MRQITELGISRRYIYAGNGRHPDRESDPRNARPGPKSGYEIKGLVDRSTRFFWAASYGQIYPELRRLSDAGLIEGTRSRRAVGREPSTG